jgi:hypothetical protein
MLMESGAEKFSSSLVPTFFCHIDHGVTQKRISAGPSRRKTFKQQYKRPMSLIF